MCGLSQCCLFGELKCAMFVVNVGCCLREKNCSNRCYFARMPLVSMYKRGRHVHPPIAKAGSQKREKKQRRAKECEWPHSSIRFYSLTDYSSQSLCNYPHALLVTTTQRLIKWVEEHMRGSFVSEMHFPTPRIFRSIESFKVEVNS